MKDFDLASYNVPTGLVISYSEQCNFCSAEAHTQSIAVSNNPQTTHGSMVIASPHFVMGSLGEPEILRALAHILEAP